MPGNSQDRAGAPAFDFGRDTADFNAIRLHPTVGMSGGNACEPLRIRRSAVPRRHPLNVPSRTILFTAR